MSDTKGYIVYFKGKGFTAPNAKNPNGIKITGSGHIFVEGPRPTSVCKKVFMEETFCVRYYEDEPGFESYPTIRLGKAI